MCSWLVLLGPATPGCSWNRCNLILFYASASSSATPGCSWNRCNLNLYIE